MASGSYDGAGNVLPLPEIRAYSNAPSTGMTSTLRGNHTTATKGNTQTAANDKPRTRDSGTPFFCAVAMVADPAYWIDLCWADGLRLNHSARSKRFGAGDCFLFGRSHKHLVRQ